MNNNKITEKVLSIIEKQLYYQNAKGLRKYGQTLAQADHNAYDWNIMVIQELVDAIQYLVKENERLNNAVFSNTDDLVNKVALWSINRHLNSSDPVKQMLKLGEEYGELCEGFAKDDHALIKDSIGDMLVVLIILCQQIGLSLEECLGVAYNEIKDRKGKMVNGVFVKESDLK